MQKILIFGNMGYIGPCVVEQLRSSNPEAQLIGYDNAYFAHCLTGANLLPEVKLDRQIFGDVRKVSSDIFHEVKAVVYLAAISNDPMGNIFETPTYKINYESAIDIASKAKDAGVVNFVFASSCSMYGAAGDRPRREGDEQHPLTAYAKSKVLSENKLGSLADDKFIITSLRFGTACGMSDRLRLDLVLNDFVASAVANKEIVILSDGTPWRPLIHVRDMARAIDWAVERDNGNGGAFLSVNVGKDDWNYQIKDLASAVADIIPGCDVSINTDAMPDKRSYQVSFELFKTLAPNHQPIYSLEDTIKELKAGLEKMDFEVPGFRDTWFMRLNVLKQHIKKGRLNDNLNWIKL